MNTSKGEYLDTTHGQIHVRIHSAAQPGNNHPLVCLPPSPYSGVYYATVMPLLATVRDVIAVDYPGYGGSYALEQPGSITDYASALMEALNRLDYDGPFDLMGFHTGCLVACELATLYPSRIGKVVPVDVPFFDAEKRVKLGQDMSKPLPVSADLGSLEGTWEFNVGNRIQHVPLQRAFELFVDHLRSGTHDFYAFSAAFSYPCDEKFAQLKHHVNVLATQSGLLEHSRNAAELFPDATFTHIPQITTAVFEAGAETIVEHINQALTQ